MAADTTFQFDPNLDFSNYLQPDAIDYTTAQTDSGTSVFGTGWLDSLGKLATTGLGIWSTLTTNQAQTDLAKAKLAAQQQQAATSGTFWKSIAGFMPLILIGGAVMIGAVVLLRRK